MDTDSQHSYQTNDDQLDMEVYLESWRDFDHRAAQVTREHRPGVQRVAAGGAGGAEEAGGRKERN